VLESIQDSSRFFPKKNKKKRPTKAFRILQVSSQKKTKKRPTILHWMGRTSKNAHGASEHAV
jgi:hypothetical protein